jgi:hypothetical protein
MHKDLATAVDFARAATLYAKVVVLLFGHPAEVDEAGSRGRGPDLSCGVMYDAARQHWDDNIWVSQEQIRVDFQATPCCSSSVSHRATMRAGTGAGRSR